MSVPTPAPACELCGLRRFCARCRPEDFSREVDRIKTEILKCGGLVWRDEFNRTHEIDVPVRLRGRR